ncbi:TetR/AcrR family transcriptional regulator [Actinomadura madurae]|nr:TetR/AcrR family transcriptional regulator [Actinomadura madurae]MCP9983807.1 TetR/AcrR family transcriptional regulator [Actinomadura madurae]
MPRVSEEHLERRRRQILEAARACFVRKGIHETSMQDIFAEAGLSAGAVYRYFKSKNEIIEANVATVVGELHAFFDELGRSEPLLPVDQVMERLAGKVVDLSGEDGPLRLAPRRGRSPCTIPRSPRTSPRTSPACAAPGRPTSAAWSRPACFRPTPTSRPPPRRCSRSCPDSSSSASSSRTSPPRSWGAECGR